MESKDDRSPGAVEGGAAGNAGAAAATGALAAGAAASAGVGAWVTSARSFFAKLFLRQRPTITVEGVGLRRLAEVGAQMDGFSGREISKTMLGVQGAVYGSMGCVCDGDLFESVIEDKLAEHVEHRGSRSPLSKHGGGGGRVAPRWNH
jgi:hypothetical protein